MGQEGLYADVDGSHRGFQLVVDIVGQLFLYPILFLLLVHGGCMFAVAVGHGLLQAGIEAHYVV